MDDLAIRDLRPGDVETIVDIAIAAWRPIYAGYRRTMGEELFATAFSNWPEKKAGQIRRACDPASGAMVGIVEWAGQIVGFVTCYANERTQIGEIGNNAVHPDAQGQGIGTQMYAYALERLRERGMRYVKVGTGGDRAHDPGAPPPPGGVEDEQHRQAADCSPKIQS